MFPAESFGVTVNRVACPIPTLTCIGVTASEAIGAAPTTAWVVLAKTPSLAVAVIVAVPIPTFVARPVFEMATIVESLLVQAND
jgi:hypothetical protein